MRFLANENYPYPSILLLRKNGLEVISISENWSGISDEEVLSKAVDENLIILTFDRDYGELLFKYKRESPPAVIYYRIKGKTPQDAAIILFDLLDNQSIMIDNYFTVIEENAIRQRKLS